MTDDTARPNHIAIAHALLRADTARTNAERALAKVVAQAAIPAHVTPPAHVDDCGSDTYDEVRARLAWLEARHRDTVDSEQAAALVTATVALGERNVRIAAARALTDDLLNAVSPEQPATRIGYRILAALDGTTPESTT